MTETVSPSSAVEVAQLLKSVPPRPWNWTWVAANASGGGHIYLTDDNGRKIGFQARSVLGTTRRVAVPLLERLDADHVTARMPDDRRVVRPEPGRE